MAAWNKFNTLMEDLAHGVHNLGVNQLRVALTNTAPGAGNAELGDITQIAYTNCSSRAITTSGSSQTGGTYKLTLADLVLTASGGTVGPFRYVVIYNDTVAGDPLIAWYDYGSSITLNDGETLTINFDDANGLFQLA